MFDTAKFGALVASLRKNADMTQSELADRLGLTRQAISRYECGDSFPDISILREMAGIFGISVELLISAGNPTDGEAQILRSIAEGGEPKEVNAADVASLAPWLKPSILAKLSESMEKSGIGIAHLVALAARTQVNLRYGGYGSKRLATETHRLKRVKVGGRAYLRCGMALKSHARVGLGHAFAIVHHLYKSLSRILYYDCDVGRSCVYGVFHKLLDDRRRTIHDFACRYLVCDGVG